MPVIFTPDCSEANASAPAGGGAGAQSQRPAIGSLLRRASPAPPNARKFLRSTIFLQRLRAYLNAEAGFGGEPREAVLHPFQSRTAKLRAHGGVFRREGERNLLDEEIGQTGGK